MANFYNSPLIILHWLTQRKIIQHFLLRRIHQIHQNWFALRTSYFPTLCSVARFFRDRQVPRSELPLHSLENIFAHDRLVYIVAYYPLGFVLGAAPVADRLRHTFVADTTPMETGIGMSSNLTEYQKRIMVR